MHARIFLESTPVGSIRSLESEVQVLQPIAIVRDAWETLNSMLTQGPARTFGGLSARFKLDIFRQGLTMAIAMRGSPAVGNHIRPRRDLLPFGPEPPCGLPGSR